MNGGCQCMQPSNVASELCISDQPARQSALEGLSAVEHPRCILCGTANPFGPKLRFAVQRDGSVRTEVACPEALQSYPKMLHGGVIAALLDATMTNLLFSQGVVAVTAELNIRFLAPARLDRVIVARAALEGGASHDLYRVRGELEQDGRLVARGSAKFLSRDRL